MVLVMTLFHRGTIFTTPSSPTPRSSRRTKISSTPNGGERDAVADDPRRADRASRLLPFYLHPELGPISFVLCKRQQMTILRDYAQEVDAIGQGRHPLLIGTADFVVINRAKQADTDRHCGRSATSKREPMQIQPTGISKCCLTRRRIPMRPESILTGSWSKEGQTVFARANGYVSAPLRRAGRITPSP